MFSSYKNIIEINFKYPQRELSADFQVIPTSGTRQLMNRYRLIFKQKGTVCYVLQTFKNQETAFVDIDEDLYLRFFLKFQHQHFIGLSDLDLYDPRKKCLFITNENSVSDEIVIDNSFVLDKIPYLMEGFHVKTLPDFERANPRYDSDGVYKNLETNEKQALFSFKENDKSGFLDYTYKPAKEKKELTIRLNARKVLVEYVIFDRLGLYEGFNINAEELEFQSQRNEEKTTIKTTREVGLDELKGMQLSLSGRKKNGRTAILRERLPLPSIINLNKNNLGKFQLSSFIYL